MGPRVFFYTHDSYGLGHLRRTLVLSRFLATRWPRSPQLIVTGSPVAQHLLRPGDAPHVSLPPVIKVGPNQYVSRDPLVSPEAIFRRRAETILRSALDFQPDILVVDHAPAGLKGELRDVIERWGTGPRRSRFVLSLRDVVDGGDLVRRIWTREGIYDLLDRVYDLIIVYGWQEGFDIVREYALFPAAAAKVRYVGYLGRDEDDLGCSSAEVALDGDPLVVVAAGSGQDGYPLLRTMADAVRAWPHRAKFRCVMVGGPLMPDADQQRLRDLAIDTPGLHFMGETNGMAALIRAAAVVVSMAGFNTVCEILSSGRPAVLIPRVERTEEQRIRAAILERRRLVRVLDPRGLDPGVLLETVLELLDNPGCLQPPPTLGGLPAFVAALEALLSRNP